MRLAAPVKQRPAGPHYLGQAWLGALLPILAWLLGNSAPPAQAASTDFSHHQAVYVSIGVLDVDAVSSAEQNFTVNLYVQFRWQDPTLAHSGEFPIRRQLREIAAPRFLLLNRQKTWSSLLDVVDITPSGEAVYMMRLWGDFSQPLGLQDFPFDEHEFSIPIIAISRTGKPVALQPDPEYISFLGKNFSVPDWEITGSSSGVRTVEITRGDDVTQGFVFSFYAKRIYEHHVIKFIIPLILIVAMSWIVFWIDPREASSQLSVAVTAALTVIAYHIALANNLPDIPYLTRMDKFLFASTLMVFAALLEVVFTSRLANRGGLVWATRLDLGSRIVFPASYALIAAWALGV